MIDEYYDMTTITQNERKILVMYVHKVCFSDRQHFIQRFTTNNLHIKCNFTVHGVQQESRKMSISSTCIYSFVHWLYLSYAAPHPWAPHSHTLPTPSSTPISFITSAALSTTIFPVSLSFTVSQVAFPYSLATL